MTLSQLFQQQGVLPMPIGSLTVPLRFSSSAIIEYWATRQRAGLFDFSFMAHFEISGPDSLAYLQHLQVRDLRQLATQQIYYTLLCNTDGSVRIDATVWRIEAERYWLFTGRRNDAAYLSRTAGDFRVEIDDLSGQYSVLALQGPRSLAILQRCRPATDLSGLRYFRFMETELLGFPCRLARLGYTGELGYEILVPAEAAADFWMQLLSAGENLGLAPCGFAAADILRIEAGYILFTNELTCPVTPYEINLARLLSPFRRDYLGAAALRALRFQPPQRRLAGLLLPHWPAARQAPRCSALHPEASYLTSCCVSPALRQIIGLGFVPAAAYSPGARVPIEPQLSAQVTRLPFYDPGQRLPRQQVARA